MDKVTKVALDARFYAMLAAVGLATFVVHESAHWIAGKAMGLDLRFSLNGVTPTGVVSDVQHAVMSAAGPIVTIVQALIAFGVLRGRASTIAFAALLWAAFMRLVASGLSVALPNDEARVSLFLGLGFWTLPVIVSVGLCALAWIGARRFAIRWRDGLLIYLTLSIVTAAIVFGDRFLL